MTDIRVARPGYIKGKTMVSRFGIMNDCIWYAMALGKVPFLNPATTCSCRFGAQSCPGSIECPIELLSKSLAREVALLH